MNPHRDWDKISTLLHIAETSMKWPHLRHIHDAAMDELKEIKTKPEEKVKPEEEPVEHPVTEPLPRRPFGPETEKLGDK